MKLIKKLPNNELEVEVEDILESLYEEGEFIEFDGRDYQIIKKENRRYVLR